MNKIREKAQGRTKQIVGQMVGDELLVQEGKEQEREAEHDEGDEHREPSDDRHERPTRGSRIGRPARLSRGHADMDLMALPHRQGGCSDRRRSRTNYLPPVACPP
jgi:hypothetical protein